MSSKIEQQIDQILDYMDSCKLQTFSKTNIIVDKDELVELLEELRASTPEEIKHYQRIINNKDTIIEDAHRKADEILDEANIRANEMISEHSITAQAQDYAQGIVDDAQAQAEDIVNRAIDEANAYKASSAQYLEDMLSYLQTNTQKSLNNLTDIFSDLHGELSEFVKTVENDRSELSRQSDSDYNREQGSDNDGDYPSADMIQ